MLGQSGCLSLVLFFRAQTSQVWVYLDSQWSKPCAPFFLSAFCLWFSPIVRFQVLYTPRRSEAGWFGILRSCYIDLLGTSVGIIINSITMSYEVFCAVLPSSYPLKRYFWGSMVLHWVILIVVSSPTATLGWDRQSRCPEILAWSFGLGSLFWNHYSNACTPRVISRGGVWYMERLVFMGINCFSRVLCSR